MAVKYRLYQNTRQGSEQYGLWYARASYDKDDEVGTTELARQISHATTLTPTDVRACIASFLYYINDNLRNGKKVKLETLGSFKVGLRTAPSKKASEFKASSNIDFATLYYLCTVKLENGKRMKKESNIKGMKIIFTPAMSENATSIDRTKALLEGVKVVEKGAYTKPEDEQPEP